MSSPRSLLVGVALLGFLLFPVGASGASPHKLPAAGTWHVEDVFPDVIGGSMVVSGSRRQVKRLELTTGRDKSAACGSVVRLRGRPAIRRLGDDAQPAVGRVELASPVIDPATVSVTVRGKRRSGRLRILFDRSGRRASAAELKAGGCSLSFVLAR